MMKKGNTRRNGGMHAADWLRLLAVVLIPAALLLAAARFLPGEEAAQDGGVRILRVMTSNPDTCMAVGGEYCDWLELVNLSDAPADLTGWRLTKEMDVRTGWVLPGLRLEPGESRVIYAAQPVAGAPEDALFCGFSLSADGETLSLLDADARFVQTLEIPALAAGAVYALEPAAGSYAERSPYAPLGAGMDLAGQLEPGYDRSAPVLSELMAANKSVLATEEGVYADWIELHNPTGRTVELAGWSLTDDPMNRRKWVFPEAALEPDGYLIVWADGTERAVSGLHASFRLSSEGEQVWLCSPEGDMVSAMQFGALDANESVVRTDAGTLEKTFLPSPAQPNTPEGARKSIDVDYIQPVQNALGLYINEVMCSVEGGEDWLELHNASGATVELSGFGLSNNPNRPRKWQFPDGASVPAGGYLAVKLTGSDGESGLQEGVYCADFALNVESDEVLLLATAQGEVLDRMLLTGQRRGVSYGRAAGEDGYRFFTEPTPNRANSAKAYEWCATDVEFSVPGGLQTGDSVELALTAQEGMRIYYTTDGAAPSSKSKVYDQPLKLTKNTVVKAIAWRDGAIPSEMRGNTYIFGAEHSGCVVAVSGKRSQLNGSGGTLNTGVTGDGYDVYAEFYSPEGERLIGQECFLHLNGRSTRLEYDQKAFRLVAKREYGDNRFRAPLFEERDYDGYKSVILRCAGQDNQGAFMRDVFLTSRARNTSVMYQEYEPAVVYVNGEYWGQYYIRERITPESICQFEGWDNPDAVDLLEGNGAVVQGSNETYYDMMSFVRRNSLRSDANLEKLRSYMDVENYLEYVMLEMYSGNHDLNNVRMYRSAEEGGQWHWVLFDLDLGMRTESNIVAFWSSGSGEVGSITSQSNVLFYELMKNDYARDYFLTRFGELLATDMSEDGALAEIQEIYGAIAPEMERHCDRWDWSVSVWREKGEELIKRVRKRPRQLIVWLMDEFDLSNAEAEHYFGAARDKILE